MIVTRAPATSVRALSSRPFSASFADSASASTPASASASRALVNDLDLKVTEAATGKVYQTADRINNAEMVELSGLAPGAYTVSVVGVNVPQGKNGKQPYALIVSK